MSDIQERIRAEENYQRYQQTGQSAIKLECAIRGYFELPEVTESEKKTYAGYLKLRNRPASEYLVHKDETEKLSELYQLGGFSEQQLMKLIQIAGEEGKLSSLAWLLRLKKEKYGYRDKDFSL